MKPDVVQASCLPAGMLPATAGGQAECLHYCYETRGLSSERRLGLLHLPGLGAARGFTCYALSFDYGSATSTSWQPPRRWR